MPIARVVAHEWQTDGYLKPGTIKRVRMLTTEEFVSDVMGWSVMGTFSFSASSLRPQVLDSCAA